MMKKIFILLLSGMALGFSHGVLAELDDDQLTGDLLLQESNPELKSRQVGVEKIVIRRDIEGKQQQVTPDGLEQVLNKKRATRDNDIQILNAQEVQLPKTPEQRGMDKKGNAQSMRKPAISDVSDQVQSGSEDDLDGKRPEGKFLGIFEREQKRNSQQLTPDPLLDDM